MLSELAVFVRSAHGEAKVLTLTGTGRIFSAGADLEDAKAGLAVDPIWEDVSGEIARFEGLSIAALNGTMAGGAFGMALACDLRICTPHAKFFYPVMKLGFMPQPSDPARLSALVGPARAKMLLLGGQKIEATEALSWGLVDRIVEVLELQTTVESISNDAANATLAHASAIKELFAQKGSKL
jgi:enoyl-CoA hydratase/carnithine racemase